MALSRHQPTSSSSSAPTPNFPSNTSISTPNPVPTTRLFSTHLQSTSESSSDSDSPSESPSEDPSKNSSDSSSDHSENSSENLDEDSEVHSSQYPSESSSEPPSDRSENSYEDSEVHSEILSKNPSESSSENSDEYSGVHSEAPSENSPENSSDDQDTRNVYWESRSATVNRIADLLGPDGRLKPEERQRRMDNGLCLRCGEFGHMVSNCPLYLPWIHLYTHSYSLLLLIICSNFDPSTSSILFRFCPHFILLLLHFYCTLSVSVPLLFRFFVTIYSSSVPLLFPSLCPAPAPDTFPTPSTTPDQFRITRPDPKRIPSILNSLSPPHRPLNWSVAVCCLNWPLRLWHLLPSSVAFASQIIC